MLIEFHKYQGAGNDFILIDNQSEIYSSLSTQQIKKLCDRHFGIGADGLMMLNKSDSYDFKMRYFNADGNESTMCGNGGRCIVKFALEMKIVSKNYTEFEAIDGVHSATILENENISLKMNNVKSIEKSEFGYITNTGSPHLVIFSTNINAIDLLKEARKIRYNDTFKKEGINVNYVEIKNDALFSRTYERGVENETLACGTGAIAIALTYASLNHNENKLKYAVNAIGGQLEISFDTEDYKSFNNIFLAGPAAHIFSGNMNI